MNILVEKKGTHPARIYNSELSSFAGKCNNPTKTSVKRLETAFEVQHHLNMVRFDRLKLPWVCIWIMIVTTTLSMFPQPIGWYYSYTIAYE